MSGAARRRAAAAAALAALAAGAPATGGARAAGWGAEERVTATATDSETGLSHNPLAVDSRGDLHVVWAEQDGPSANYQIWSARRRQLEWDAPQRAVAYLVSYPGSGVGAKYPSLVIDAEDTLHVAWHDYRIGGIQNVEIFTKSRGIDAAWDTTGGSDVRLTHSAHPETNGDNSYLPTLVQDPGGELIVAWYDYRFDGNNAEILAKAREGGAWDTTPGDAADTRLSATSGNSVDPAVAVDSAGGVHVVWAEPAPTGAVLVATRDATTKAWAAAETVSTGGTATGSPAACVASNGALVVAWVDTRYGGQAIVARERPVGGAWGAESRVSPLGANAAEPALAAGPDGRVHAAWHDTRVSLLNREIFLQSRASGGWDSSGASDTRVSNAGGHSTRPSIVVDAAAGLHVVWKDRRDGNNEIYYRRWTDPVLTRVGDAPRTAPAGAIALRAAPNPAHAGTTLWLALGAGGSLDVRAFDAAGREVRALFRGVVAAGERALAWDARDGAGHALPAGVYFVRAAAPSGAATTRVLLLPGAER
jgi:hypothetical protein